MSIVTSQHATQRNTHSYGIWRQYPAGGADIDKASHLALHPGMVQSRNVLLATVALNGRDILDNFLLTPAGNLYTSMATNLLLPLEATEVFLIPAGGHTAGHAVRIPRDKPFTVDIPLGSTLALRVGRGAFACRVFALDGAGGQKPHLQLKGDANGMPFGAMRLVGYHFASAKPTNLTSAADSHVRFAALLVAASASDHAALAALARSVASANVSSTTNDVHDGSRLWEAAVEYTEAIGGGGNNPPEGSATGAQAHRLAVQRNLTCSQVGGLVANQSTHTRWNCLVQRTVNGSSVIPGHLRVNGVPLAPLP